jgi:hypothetical protein
VTLASKRRAVGPILLIKFGKRLGLSGYFGIGLQPCARQISYQPRCSAVTLSLISPRVSRLLSVRALCSRRDKRRFNMSNINKFRAREWLVPPVLLPILFVLLVGAAMLFQR